MTRVVNRATGGGGGAVCADFVAVLAYETQDPTPTLPLAQKIRNIAGMTVCEFWFAAIGSGTVTVKCAQNPDGTGTQYGDSVSLPLSGSYGSGLSFAWDSNKPVIPAGTHFWVVITVAGGSITEFQIRTGDPYETGLSFDLYSNGAPYSTGVDLRFGLKTMQ